ncbi:MAG: LysR family transcriptional regulator [Proteobacteria bacterium]|nr:LysR family transcriptional regulator [Pseudomonadota bacterium]
MDKLRQIESFVAVTAKGSLTAAARAEGVAPAVIGRRIDALEARLGVKLLMRTTRRLSLTHEGSAFLEDCQRLLSDLANAEASVSAGGARASGQLRITAPAGFGRRRIAPLVPGFLALHPDASVSLNLSDRIVDIVNEGYDCAVRLGELADSSSLASVRLGDNHRLCVATPDYLKRAGTPAHPNELLRHQCLTLTSDVSQTRGWTFHDDDGRVIHLRPSGRLDCSDGQVLHEWCLAGLGIAWRSTWEVEDEVATGRLVQVLDAYAAPPNGIHAVFPHARHMPLRTRLWIDFLKSVYARRM